MKRVLPVCLLLAACTVGPDYKEPQIVVPQSFPAPSRAEAPLSLPVFQNVDLSAWWQQFQDPELEGLIRRALAQNLDLLTAESRVREARQQEIVAGAKGLPQVNAMASTVQLHSGSNPLAGLAGGSSSSGTAPSRGANLHLYSAGFDATWEIDIFGGVRRSVEAAEAGTEAARWQMRDGEVSLTAEIAADYVALRTDQARLAIVTQQEKSQSETLALVTARAHAGFVTELDVNQQQQLLSQTQAQRPPLEVDLTVQRNAIAVLLGMQPGALDGELNLGAALPPVPPHLPIGLPADLLRKRPDIRMAERKLAQATADIGVATADLYPKFDLLAAISSASSGVGGLFNSGSVSQVGLGSITWPIFHGGQIHANIHAKEEEEQQAYLAWQEVVLGGLRDAEDALARYAAEQRRLMALDTGASTARASTALALQQYRFGLVTYASVLQSQSTQLQAEDALTQSRSQLTADLVSLFKALGGGWHEDAALPPLRSNPVLTR